MGRAGSEQFIIALEPRRSQPPYPETPPLAAPVSGLSVAEPSRLLVAGDVHGDINHLMKLIREAVAQDCQAILQVGDFGFWLHRSDDVRSLRKISKVLDEAGVDLFFIEGNHDDYSKLWGYKHPMRDGWPTIGERIYFIPRGTRWTWQGKRFLAVGGAVSVDRSSRLRHEAKSGKPHTKWWPQEALTEEQADLFAAGGEADIVISHDAPLGASIDGTDIIDGKNDPETTDNRRRLRRIIDAAGPELIIHGHYHQRYSGEYPSYPLGRSIAVEGLGMNGMGEKSFLILDAATLTVS